MKQTQLIMGMPITIEVVDHPQAEPIIAAAFERFRQIDARYSTYKEDSEISQINRGLPPNEWSDEMRVVMELCDQTKSETGGYFDITRDGQLDPSGLVKGWAIDRVARLLLDRGVENFFVDAGGDIQVRGANSRGEPWRVGIRNPFNREEIVRSVAVSSEGVATSGTAIRGAHIYNPLARHRPIDGITSLTVIGPNIYEADRFATATFAMGRVGIDFIEARAGLEGYLIDDAGIATLTSGFARYVAQ